MSYQFNDLKDLFICELKDLYDAEQQLTEALPLMAQAATDPQLRQAFEDHFRQTQTHIARLEQVFRGINCEPEREACPAMKGIVKEGNDMISAKGDCSVRDAGLIAAAQRAEHYEIAGYGTVRTFARQLGRGDLASVLQMTLDEEGDTDKKLTAIAESSINQMAQA
ncbi:MAG TPA: ferritin-like domain-containing protein [Tepidisphaeraceae bacterium]|nr:ferritin-like domain-containing protein [Tepidisphaeraceae bacterium]